MALSCGRIGLSIVVLLWQRCLAANCGCFCRRRRRGAKVRPDLHEQNALFQQVAPAVRCLDLVRQAMRQRMLAHLRREGVGHRLGALVAEHRAKAVDGDTRPVPAASQEALQPIPPAGHFLTQWREIFKP